jgi:hypothetical protein
VRKHCPAPPLQWSGVFTQLGTAPTNPRGWVRLLRPPELPRTTRRRFRSIGRGHALQRIDLYPVRVASTLFPQSVFTSAEARKRRWRTKLLLGCEQPSIFPVANRLTAGAVSSLTSWLDLECGSFRNNAIFDEAPERYRELSSQRDNADLATTHTLVPEAFVPPQRQLAVGLVPEPEPSQLDQCLPSELGARLTDAAITIGVAASVGAGREPHE